MSDVARRYSQSNIIKSWSQLISIRVHGGSQAQVLQLSEINRRLLTDCMSIGYKNKNTTETAGCKNNTSFEVELLLFLVVWDNLIYMFLRILNKQNI